MCLQEFHLLKSFCIIVVLAIHCGIAIETPGTSCAWSSPEYGTNMAIMSAYGIFCGIYIVFVCDFDHEVHVGEADSNITKWSSCCLCFQNAGDLFCC